MSTGRIAVVVPAYCEERLIGRTISDLPASVGQVIVVDDGSPDATAERARELNDPRVIVVRHDGNRGVGAAIYTGYQKALRGPCDVFVVMAGDDQMDRADLEEVARPVLQSRADYVKGNRLIHPRCSDMPRLRRLGTQALAWITSFACGTRLGDSQCGYTALSRAAASQLTFSRMWSGYGYPNDLLIALAARRLRIVERPVRPVYGDEVSGLRPWHFVSILRVIAAACLRERAALLSTSHALPASHLAMLPEQRSSHGTSSVDCARLELAGKRTSGCGDPPH